MTRALRRRLRDERGEAAPLSLLLILGGLILPLMFLVALGARIELAHVDAQQAARYAVRAAVEAPDAAAADADANAAFAREQAGTSAHMIGSLTGTFVPGDVMNAQVTVAVPIGSLPFLGRIGTVVVRGQAAAPVDRYRSVLPTGAP
jgi:hypothetical protein